MGTIKRMQLGLHEVEAPVWKKTWRFAGQDFGKMHWVWVRDRVPWASTTSVLASTLVELYSYTVDECLS